jgi:hypothetical protein
MLLLSAILLSIGCFGLGYNSGEDKNPRDVVNHLYSTVPTIAGWVLFFINNK